MSLSKEVPVFYKDQIDLLDFPDNFGDLSPIKVFQGPKTPSNRQVLRNILYCVSQGRTLQESADEVVNRVLLKHPSETTNLKHPRTLVDDLMNIFKEARF